MDISPAGSPVEKGERGSEEDRTPWTLDFLHWLKSREGMRIFGGMGALGVIALGLYFAGFFSSLGSEPETIERLTNVKIPDAIDEQPVIAKSVGAELIKGAYIVLDKFITAKAPEEKLKWVIRPEAVEVKLRQYYGTHSLEEGITVSEFSAPEKVSYEDIQRGIIALMKFQPLEVDPLTENHDATFGKTKKGPLEMLAFFRQTDSGLRLDWESYIQVKSGGLRKFLGSTKAAPGTYRVRLTRSHYFGEKRAPSNTISVQLDDIVPLTATEQPFVFIPSRTELAAEIDQNLPWSENLLDSTRYATVRLAWKPNLQSPTEKRLVIEQLICWELLGVGS